MFNLYFKNERLVVNIFICMGCVLCMYFISYKIVCNFFNKLIIDFFKCYLIRYVIIRFYVIVRCYDDKIERYFMESINNIFFKIKFYI